MELVTHHTTNFIKSLSKYNKYFIIIAFIVLIGIIGYYLSYYYRNKSVINKLEQNYNSNIPYQTDYGSRVYLHRPLTDYHVNSSYNSANLGYQRYDHLSVDAVKQLIYYGVRYFDFSIYSKTQENDSEPIISVGNKKGDWKLTRNVLSCEDVFRVFHEYAFSEQFINNYSDPVFIFLDINTDNTTVLDKLYDIIRKTVGNKLLDSSYYYQKRNIANTTVNHLMDKLVIMANNSYHHSRLAELINISTVSPNLERLRFSEIILQKKFNLNKPDFYIRSKKIAFHSGISYDYISISDYGVNFLDMNLNKKFLISTSGSKLSDNNTGEELLEIESITKNKISFKKNDKIKFKREPIGTYIIISGYTISEKGKDIEELNKSRLTIVIPDDNLFSINFNPKNIWYLGCQFVALNYTNNDENMNMYRQFFNKRSLRLKQSSLLSDLDTGDEKCANLNSNFGYNKPDYDTIYNINFDLIKDAINSEVLFKPYNNEKSIRVMYNDTDQSPRLSIDFNETNSLFQIEKSDYNLTDSVRIRKGEYYLAYPYNDRKGVEKETKYLTFITKPVDKKELIDFNRSTAFLLLNSLNNKKGYSSIGFVKEEDVDASIYSDATASKRTNKVLYYIKYKYNFNYNTKIYTKKTNRYKKVVTLNFTDRNVNNTIHIYRPRANGLFYPLGDVLFTDTELDKLREPAQSTTLVGGAIAKPIDYELVYDNKHELYNPNIEYISVWKPIAPDGYIALGVVVKKGKNYTKPSRDEIRCVASEFTELSPFPDNEPGVNINALNFSRYNVEWHNKKIGFWKGSNLRYVVSSEIFKPLKYDAVLKKYNLDKPNEFDYPIYSLKNGDNVDSDRLFLDKSNKSIADKDAATFSAKISYTESEFTEYNIRNNLSKIKDTKNKFRNYSLDNLGNNMCLSLPYAYWTDYYTNRGSGESENIEATLPENIYFTGKKKCPADKLVGVGAVYADEQSCLAMEGKMPGHEIARTRKNPDYKGVCYLDLCEENNSPYFINKDNTCRQDSEIGKIQLETTYQDCISMSGNPIIRNTASGKIPQFSKDKKVKCGLSVCSMPSRDTIEMKKRGETCSNNSNTSGFYFKTNDTVCDSIGGEHDGSICRKDLCYTTRKTSSDIKAGRCRGPGYFGTNWIHDKYNTVRLKDSKDNCLSASLDENFSPIVGDTEDNKIVLNRCLPSKIGQEFKYTDYNNLQFVSQRDGPTNFCITRMNDNSLKLLNCHNDNINQKWNFKQLPLDYCLNINDIVWVKHTELRIKKITISNVLNIPFENFLKETYDPNYIHMWIKGSLTGITKNNEFEITAKGISKKVLIGEADVVPDYKLKPGMIQQGSRVIVKNGSFRGANNNLTLKESDVLWDAVVVKKLDDGLYQVVFSINTIEPDKKNNSQGRPDYVQVKSIPIEDIRLVIAPSICK